MGMLLLIFSLFVPPGLTDNVKWDHVGPQCQWTVTDLTMESTARALLHYCLATAPASELLMTEVEDVKTPDGVVEKFCHGTGSLTRFQSSIFDLLDAAWHPDRDVNHNYDFLLTLTDKVKMKNYEAARRSIGSFLAELYRRVIPGTECPSPTQQRMIMAGAETLYSQLRGIVGNDNFSRLFGLKSLSKPAINLRNGKSNQLTMSRIGLTLGVDKPAALYTSASENRAKVIDLGVSNHADLNTQTLYMDVMRDVQPGTTIYIVTSSPLPAVSDNFISTIGAAQTSRIAINVVLVSASRNISPRSQDLYEVMAKFTKGKVYKSSADDLYKLIPMVEYGLVENQALVLSRVIDERTGTFQIPTDRSMKAMTVEVNCGGGAPRIKLFEPLKKSHFEFVELVKLNKLGFWLIENIIPGKWEVEVTCTHGPIDIAVKSESTINFQVEQLNHDNAQDLVIKSLSLPKLKLQSAKVIGAAGTEEYGNATIHHQVARLKKTGSVATIDYDWTPPSDEGNDIDINDYTSKDMGIKSLLVADKIAGPLSSRQPLMAQVIAIDENDDDVQREFPQYENRLQVKDDVTLMDFQPGNTIYVTIKVINLGETMHLTATDYEGWVHSISPATTSALDKHSLVKVRIIAPNDVKVGHETTVTVTARNNNLERIESVKFVLAVGQTENPEVKKMLVDSNIENRFGRTIVQSRVVNQHRFPRDAVFSVFLPHSAFITSYQLYIRNHTFKGEIIEPKHLGAPTDWVSPSTVVMEDEHEWRVKVRMEEWDEALFELVYDQPITKSNGKHPYKVNLQGRQQIDELDIQVALYDEDGIKDVAVIANDELQADAPLDGFGFRGLGDLGRTGAGLMDPLFGAESMADITINEGGKSASISLNPTASLGDMSRSQGPPRANPAAYLLFYNYRRVS